MSELPLRASALIVFYFLLMLAYSLKLKGIVLLDVFIIAFGFMLRVIVGAYSINVVVSKWLFITTLFLSLFLAISKRRMELFFSFQNRESQISEQRKVLDEYTLRFADQMVTITASGAVISYALYTISERTVSIFKTEALIYTTVFVLYGIFRYMYLIYRKNIGENPTDIILSDAPMLINILLWFVSCVIIIYRNKIFEVFSLN
jgi:4-hydroxybenzoate polyprenyltransferase